MEEAKLTLLSYTDSDFTNPHDIANPAAPVDYRGNFSHLGVKMEGLESKRHLNLQAKHYATGVRFCRSTSIHNTVELRLERPFLVKELIFDTSFFTGNQVKTAHQVVLQHNGATAVVLQELHLKGDAVAKFVLPSPTPASRVRLELAEGGLTRFKVLGEPMGPVPAEENVLLGASVFGSSDAHYGEPSLCLRPQREGSVMAGWETCRHSFVHRMGLVLRKPAALGRLEVDTYMHRCNPFRYVAVLGLDNSAGNLSEEELLACLPPWNVYPAGGGAPLVASDAEVNAVLDAHPGADYELGASSQWKVVLPMSPLRPDTLHDYAGLAHAGRVTHLFCLGVPDGGIHRLAAYAAAPAAAL